MDNLLAVAIIGIGFLLVVMGISGDVGGLLSSYGIALPGTENAGPWTTRPGGPPLNPNIGTMGSNGQ